MANGNQQRCCILGVCCPPGGLAQKAALESWLNEKILTSELVTPTMGRTEINSLVEKWLAELPWEKVAEESSGLADPEGHGV